ncbi:hypothetical protein [Flavobacterium alkalisoli]|uniref:hypothetical protein n=1 Tax=Flavobacterium alkalisoli TaxID=2602769 RepID=UPI003A953498
MAIGEERICGMGRHLLNRPSPKITTEQADTNNLIILVKTYQEKERLLKAINAISSLKVVSWNGPHAEPPFVVYPNIGKRSEWDNKEKFLKKANIGVEEFINEYCNIKEEEVNIETVKKIESVEKTVHEGQFKLMVDNGKLVGPMTTISQARFRKLVELHKDKYNSAETFWKMLERDLFEVNK